MPPLCVDTSEQASAVNGQDKNDRISITIENLQLIWTGYPRWQQTALHQVPPEKYRAKLISDPPGFITQLEGEFGIVILDRQNKRVCFARDITGTYPLYHRQDQGHIRIASSLSLFDKTPELNQDFLCCWLLNRYPENITPYKDIKSLPSGCYGQFAAHRLKVTRIETPDYHRVADANQASDMLREALFASIRDRCAGDDNFATHLSGGMDSPSVAAALCHSANSNGSTAYHYHLPSVPACDESELARAVAQQLKLPLTQIDAEHFGIYQPYPRQASHQLPFYSDNDLDDEIFKCMLENHQHDLFTGHGGDVLFGGPGPTRLLVDQIIARPSSLFSLVLREKMKAKNMALRTLGKTLLFDAAGQHGRPLLRSLGIKPGNLPWLKKKVFDSDELWRELGGKYDTFNEQQYGLSARLLNDGAGAMRRAIHSFEEHAGEYSIRTHHPLWTQRLITTMLSINPGLLRHEGRAKDLLRKAMTGLLPDSVLHKQHKPSYAEYYHHSIKQQATRFAHLLQHSRLADLGLIEPGVVAAEISQYTTSEPDRVARFCAVIDLEIWLQDK